MSKSKSKGSKGAAPTQELLTKVKDAAITKPSRSVKAKSKEVAKVVASKEEKKSKSKKVKEPTPEPSESESEDESGESESSKGIESEASDESSSSESSEDDTATNGVHNKARFFDEDDKEESTTESDADVAAAEAIEKAIENTDSSDEDSSDESNTGVPTAEAIENTDSSDEDSSDESNAGVPTAEDIENTDSSDEEDEDENEDDENDAKEVLAKDKGPVKAEELSKKLNPIAANTSSEEDSDEDIEDSVSDGDDSEEDSIEDSDSSDDEEEVKPAQPAKAKRKAEEVAAPAAKKSKMAEAGADNGQGGNLFVGNLSWNVDEEWLTREFEEFGELSGVRIITDRNTGRSKGFGYVEFVNAGDAAKAHAAKKGALVDNRALNIDFANKRSNEGPQERAQSRAKSFGDKSSPPSDTLFVGNLSFDAGQETVSEAFSEWGTILGVRLPTDRETGEPKGFGYVTFSSVDEAKAALENMQGAEIGGRVCRLDFSQPRPQNGESGGRGGGGFGGRGGGRGGFGGRGGGRGGFGDRGGRGGRGRGGFGDRGGRGGRGGSTNRGGFGDFAGKKVTF